MLGAADPKYRSRTLATKVTLDAGLGRPALGTRSSILRGVVAPFLPISGESNRAQDDITRSATPGFAWVVRFRPTHLIVAPDAGCRTQWCASSHARTDSSSATQTRVAAAQ